MTRSAPIVIVGAGLAGLACAWHLTQRGRSVRLLEASARPGGRVRTDAVDGFLLDRGFQVYLSAYPEGQRFFSGDHLGFRSFHAGALLRSQRGFRRFIDPRRHPFSWIGGLAGRSAYPGVSLGELWQMGRAIRAATAGDDAALWTRPEVSAEERLAEAGVSPSVIQGFFRGFLGGIFLDGSVTTSSRMMEFVLRCFANGRAVLPAGGMEALPRHIAQGLPGGVLQTLAAVASVNGNEVALEAGERITAAEVVIATDGSTAARLLGGEDQRPRWNGTVSIWFDLPEAPVNEPLLMLDGHAAPESPINHVCVTSLVQPGLAPHGRHLLVASTAGWPQVAGPLPESGMEAFDWKRCDPAHDDNGLLLKAARQQMREWFGASATSWRPLRVDRIAHALPSVIVDERHPAPLSPHDRAGQHASGCWVCGDHTVDPSINGALRSGRLVAEQILAGE